MVRENRRLLRAERLRNALAFIELDCHAAEVFEERVVSVEGASWVIGESNRWSDENALP